MFLETDTIEPTCHQPPPPCPLLLAAPTRGCGAGGPSPGTGSGGLLPPQTHRDAGAVDLQTIPSDGHLPERPKHAPTILSAPTPVQPMSTFLLPLPLGEGGRAGWGLSSRHLQGPRLLPSWGSALLRMLEIPTSSWGWREGREGPLGNLGVRSGTMFSVHFSWAHSVLWPNLPCTGAGRRVPGTGPRWSHQWHPAPCSPGLSALPPAPVPCVLAFGWELGNALGLLWWGLPQPSSSRGGRLCRWGALHPRVCRQGACSLSGRKGSGAGP